MARRLIVLCDGTFNDSSASTNVFKFKNALARPGQLVYYDEGVGVTEEGSRKGWLGRQVDRALGGAFGSGLSGNVQQGYRWVCENYELDDELYFLGFSRGAFTARSLVGMVRKIGLVRAPVDKKTLERSYKRYRDSHHPTCPETELFRESLNTRRVEDLNIRFLGVWDTVGALGLPVVGPRSFIARKRWGFHDLKLSSHVKTARHALAIDEKRAPFLPAPWLAEPPRPGEPRDVEQRWFAGCHSDIGGNHGSLALYWMIEEAEAAGLEFGPPIRERRLPAVPQVLHESLSLPYRIGAGAVVRPILQPLTPDQPGEPMFWNETIAESAWSLAEETGGKSTPVPLARRENLNRLWALIDQKMTLRAREFEKVPERERRNLTGLLGANRIWGFSSPKPSWGLFLGYYLGQYDSLADQETRCPCSLPPVSPPAPAGTD